MSTVVRANRLTRFLSISQPHESHSHCHAYLHKASPPHARSFSPPKSNHAIKLNVSPLKIFLFVLVCFSGKTHTCDDFFSVVSLLHFCFLVANSRHDCSKKFLRIVLTITVEHRIPTENKVHASISVFRFAEQSKR